MKSLHRLDKILGHMGVGSRTEIKRMAKQGRLLVNGEIVKDSGKQIDPIHDELVVDDAQIIYREYVYFMMNKPPGVISATEDRADRTVIDLLTEEDRKFSPFPVGRLDKDTEGLLLLTNDGQLAHNLLSPRKGVHKTYYVEVDGRVGEEHIPLFETGIRLDDGYVTMSAYLHIIEVMDDQAKVELTIQEGKFHQVKRMFQAIDRKVTYLKRIAMGSLSLDEHLAIGTYRELSDEELLQLKQLQA